MAKLRLGRSYWLDQYRGPAPRFGALSGRRTVDIAVIGGGITGCVAAYLFARTGARVALLEARRIGRGSTAASTALLLQEPDVDFRHLAGRYGTAAARRIWRAARHSLQGFTGLLEGLHIHASLRQLPSIYWTRDEAAAVDLRREISRRRTAGLAGRWLSSRALRRATGIDGAGGIITQGNAQVDPYRACLGIALAARAAGARLFESCPVRKVTGDTTGVDIQLEHGAIRAGRAVIATGYATEEFRPMAGRFRMMNTYVIATPPLALAIRSEMGLGDVMLWNTERPYHYARWTPDHRVLFGGGDRPVVRGAARSHALDERTRLLMADLTDLYPAISAGARDDARPEYAWEGLFANTPDGLPYVGAHRRYPRQLFALGYGGNGMTFSYLAAQILLRAARGTVMDEDRLFAFARIR